MKKNNKTIASAIICLIAVFIIALFGLGSPKQESNGTNSAIESSIESTSEQEITSSEPVSEESILPEQPEESDASETIEPTEPEVPNSSEAEVPEEDPTTSEEVEPTEPVEPSEPEEPEVPEEPQETVSDPLSFSEGEHIVSNLKIEATAENADAVYVNGEGTVVTIESGYYDGGDNGSTTAVYARDGAKVVINDGTFKAGEDCAVIYAKNNATIEINGGFYEADGAYNGSYFVLNLSDGTNSTIIVKGGTFVNFNPADNDSENPKVNFVAEGYTVVSDEKDNGDIWYTVVKAN